MKKVSCDHIVYWHGGHDEVRKSSLSEHIEHNGKPEEWCCGGGYKFNYCPDCGEKPPR